MRRLSKPAIAITVGVVVLAVVLSIVVGMLMKNTSKKTRISQLEVNGSGSARKDAGESGVQEEEPRIVEEGKKTEGTIGEAIRKEQQMLKESEKGGYVGGVGVRKKKKDSDPLLDDIVMEEGDDDDSLSPSMPKGRGKGNIHNKAQLYRGGKNGGEGDDEQSRRKAWEYLYLQKISGGFVSKPQSAGQTRVDQGDEQPGAAGAGRGPKVSYYKPYRAVVDRTFTSAQANAVFVATGTEIPVKGWKIVGKAAANFTDNRFHVEVSGVIGPDNAHHQMKGYVASMDETDGIVSAVKHEDVAGTITSGVMAGVSSFLNALRKDTTTVEVGAGGVTVTGQTKSDDRLREGGLAAGDTIFQGLSKKAEGSTKKTPTLIMEKGVPVLIYFAP